MRHALSVFVTFAALAGCAQGSSPGTGDDVGDDIVEHDAPPADPDAAPSTDGPTIDPHIDAADIDAAPIDAMPIDAMPIDAPPAPVAVTLTQNTATTVTAGNSVSCHAGGITADNSFYRVFTLANHGVSGQFTATRVDFGIEEINAGTGTTLNVDVRLHRLNGAMTLANLTQVHTQSVPLNETLDLQNVSITLSAPVVFAAGSTVVLEVHVPDGDAAQNTFFLGSNAAGESAPSYLRTPDVNCGVPEPATYASLGFPNVHLVMSIAGTTP